MAVKPAPEVRWYMPCRAEGQRCKHCCEHRVMRSVVFTRFVDKPQLSLGLYRKAAIPVTPSTHKGHCSVFGLCNPWASYLIPRSASMD